MRTSSGSPVSGRPDVQGARDFAVCGSRMPIEVAGEDDMVPPERRGVWKQLGVVERAGPREVAGRFVHVGRVPERDGGDDEVERHGPLLLGGVRAIMNTPL